MSSLVGKWEKEVTPVAKLKTLKIRLYPTKQQKKLLDEFIDTSRYVYNRTLEHVNNGHKINFQSLRDLLVTDQTKKHLQAYKDYDERIAQLKKEKALVETTDEKETIQDAIKALNQERRNIMKPLNAEKNILIKDFELNTPKDLRSNAVQRCCDAFKTGFTNLREGNIKHFKLQYKKKTDKRQTIELTPKNISIVGNQIKILPETFKEHCYLKTTKNAKKRLQGLKIKNNADIVRFKGNYYLHLSIATQPKESSKIHKIAGVDLGIRTFATVFSQDMSTQRTSIIEYKHRQEILKKLNRKLDILKKIRKRHIRKRSFNKIEKQKEDAVNMLHWNFINHIIQQNDVIYLGDIKSHDIVKGGVNKTLNRSFNDLKFHLLKQRMKYKAGIASKKVILVQEPYTTKTCSSCGCLNNVGCNEVFNCMQCNLVTGRDINASKNILLKGLLL
jgi:IS605 OrfB family transposase